MALDPEYIKIGEDIIGCAYEVRNSTRRGLREEYYRSAAPSAHYPRLSAIQEICTAFLLTAMGLRDAFDAKAWGIKRSAPSSVPISEAPGEAWDPQFFEHHL